MTKFRLSFEDYDEAWHENVRERIKKIDAEHVARGEKPPEHGLYYSAQFDDIPYGDWEDMFGKPGTKYPDPESFPRYVEFEI